jgi:hypothetical protein
MLDKLADGDMSNPWDSSENDIVVAYCAWDV